MVQKVNPSRNRPASSFKSAGAIAYGGHGGDGFVVDGTNPTEIVTQDTDLNEANMNAFAETSGADSLDVDIDAGEAFVFGSWLAIDTSTTVTLASSTAGQTVYVGWNKGAADDVIVGLASAFGADDQRIPLWTFDTDGSGITSVTDERLIGKTIVGRHLATQSSESANYSTSGEQLLFVDTTGGEVTITLSSNDVHAGNEVVIIDAGGNASSNNIVVATESSETIDGEASIRINDENGAQRLATDGSNWFTAGGGSGDSGADRTAILTAVRRNFGAPTGGN